jgi:signal transduction histidine kinase
MMTRRLDGLGLSARLMALGLLSALLIGGAGGWVLREQLHRLVLRSFELALLERSDRLQAELASLPDERLALERIESAGDFGRIFSGWYWQLSYRGEERRSRSLWDSGLQLAQARPLPQNAGLLQLTDPRGEAILGTRRVLLLGGEAATLHVFGPARETQGEWRRIDQVLLLSQGAFILALLGFTVLQLRLGLAPLRRLRERLGAVKSGAAEQLGQGYGPDLDPIAGEMDEVLSRNARIVERARHHAADLSHALKKPLALLGAEARGGAVGSERVKAQVQMMAGLIDRHLARAGSGAGDLRHVAVAPRLAALLALMRRLHGDRGLDWALDVPEALRWSGEASDLEEMVGNLLDNAGKWAGQRVRVSARVLGNGVEIQVDDDGPGLQDEQLAQAVQRGRRFDESVEGHGLGLAIVSDIAQTYGGRLELVRSALGGLGCRLLLG